MQDTLSLGSIKLLYFRYRETVYYPVVNVGILFIIGAFLLFQILLPQFSEWFSVQREVTTIKENIRIMQANAAFLAALDQSALDEDVQAVTNAYPFANDYGGIINALNQTASRTGIALPSFSISVGDISTSGTVATPSKYAMSLAFDASLDKAKQFIDELNKTLPISGVPTITTNLSSSAISIEFYYHGFPQVTINQKEKLTPLTKDEQTLLSQIKTWRVVAPENTSLQQNESDASGSAAFPPPL